MRTILLLPILLAGLLGFADAKPAARTVTRTRYEFDIRTATPSATTTKTFTRVVPCRETQERDLAEELETRKEHGRQRGHQSQKNNSRKKSKGLSRNKNGKSREAQGPRKSNRNKGVDFVTTTRTITYTIGGGTSTSYEIATSTESCRSSATDSASASQRSTSTSPRSTTSQAATSATQRTTSTSPSDTTSQAATSASSSSSSDSSSLSSTSSSSSSDSSSSSSTSSSTTTSSTESVATPLSMTGQASTTVASTSDTASSSAASSAVSASATGYRGADGIFAPEQVDLHNQKRALHFTSTERTPSVSWNATLAQFALDYGLQCNSGHSGGPYGENLAWSTGSRDSSSNSELFDLWYDEIQNYDYSNPQINSETGHFTQVVWVNSAQIGCALVDCPGSSDGGLFGSNTPYTSLTCEYNPPGNYIGQESENVLPLGN